MQITIQPTLQQIRDTLCTAMEGGSNYWCSVDGSTYLAEGLTKQDFKAGGKCQPKDDYFHPYELIPTTENCALLIGTDDQKFGVWLNLPALQAGFELLPRAIAVEMCDEDGALDADGADVYLQYCVFGEVVYG